MRIKNIHIENFRAVKDETLVCDGLTALVGPNGAGKSTFLHALLVFQGRLAPTVEDFYNRDTDKDIEIAVTFTDLPGAASKRFATYMQGDDLKVTCIYRYDDSNGAVGPPLLHGTALRNPDFEAVRTAPKAADTLRLYGELCKSRRYSDLPKCTSKKAVLEALDTWEDDNSGKCERLTDDGRFFGFEEAAGGYLGQFARILYIPAVREASGDGAEGGRGSVLRELLDLTVKGALAGNARYQDLQKEADAVYEKARDMGGIPEVRRLEADINGTLGMLAKGAEASLEWDLQAPRVGPPAAKIRLAEDGYSTTIDRTGHGLQRTFTIAMLSSLHRAQAGASAGGSAEDGGAPSIILAIEETELYQHPTRARHLARLLSSISREGFAGVTASVQVIYATHSPYFVGADRIEQIRMLRKEGGAKGRPKTTTVRSTDMAKIQQRLAAAGAKAHADPDKLEHDFDRVLTPLMSEGFFASVVVLVEGESDRIAVTRAAELIGMPLDKRDVVVIPCGSKSGLHGPLAMFNELGVRTYVAWDGDDNKGHEKKRNFRLLSLLGLSKAEIEAGDWLGATTSRFSCCRTNLEGVLRSDMGEELYDSLVAEYVETYRLKQSDSKKKPLVAHLLMREMKNQGIRPEALGRIVEAVLAGDVAGGAGSA